MGNAGTRSGRVRAGWVLVALGAILLAGCQWTLPSYSPDGSRNNTAESTLTTSNVDGLEMEWYATLASEAYTPVAASGLVVTSSGGMLRVFDVGVRDDCSPLPWRQCAPVWTSAPSAGYLLQPIIVGDKILVFAGRTALRVYDLDGIEGCSGTPKVCAPLGEATDATTGELNVDPSLTVSGSTAYVAKDDLRAYPVSSLIDCIVTAAPCAPTWRFVPSGDDYVQMLRVVVAGGTVYASVDRSLDDDTEIVAIPEGGTGCSGTPVVCSPSWTTQPLTGQEASAVHLAATGDRLVVSIGPAFDDPTVNSGGIFAYDVETCSTAPGPCAPLWRSPALRYPSKFAIAEGLVFASDNDGETTNAFDLAGSTGCAGTPRVCTPVREYEDDVFDDGGPPVVANGILYTGGDAFDARGVVNCVVSTPNFCTPIRPEHGTGEAIVVNGRVHWIEADGSGPVYLHTDSIVG